MSMTPDGPLYTLLCVVFLVPVLCVAICKQQGPTISADEAACLLAEKRIFVPLTAPSVCLQKMDVYRVTTITEYRRVS
jgi:hypothetical protein